MNYYDATAKGYEELHKEEQRKKIKLIKKHFSVSPEEKLLDVGCGTGLTTEPWQCRRYGIDPSKELLKRARQQEHIIYKKAAAESIPYQDHFFDIVISITAIQNFQDIEQALREMKRVGKNRFVLTFLKKSPKRKKIESVIFKQFKVSKKLEEEKDTIYFIG